MLFFLCLFAFIALRLVFWFTTFPNPDEAYYWLWGQHPSWSYYDHPPLQAWVQGVFTAVLGRSPFTLRLPNLFSNGLLFYTYYRMMRYLYGGQAWSHFWVLVLLLLASPLYFLFLALAWHDHLLIALTLVAAYLFIRFLDGYRTDGKGESWRLYGAGVALGLAGLCKYNAVFVAVGLVAAVIADRQLRPLLRDRRLYRAGAIAACALIPILLWNFSNDFQSLHYYLTRSVDSGGGLHFKPFEPVGFWLLSLLTLSPVISFAMVQVCRPQGKRPKIVIDSVYPSVALWVFAVSTLSLTAIALVSTALYYWNITAYLLLFPLLPGFFLREPGEDQNADEQTGMERQRCLDALSPKELLKNKMLAPEGLQPYRPYGNPFFRGDTARPPEQAGTLFPRRYLTPTLLFFVSQCYGLFFAALLVFHYSVVPISAFFGKAGDPDSRMLFGWQTVAAAVSTQASDLGESPFLATTDYRSASALAYALNDRNVLAISDRVDQFDFWYKSDRSFVGRNAVLLWDDWHPVQPELLAQFERTAETVTVPVKRFGLLIKNYYLVKGYQFKGGRVAVAIDGTQPFPQSHH